MNMKRVIVVFTVFLYFLSSCTMLSTTSQSSTSSASYVSGKGFGTSLAALYSQYKTSGKLNFGDPTTLVNVAALSTYGSAIRGKGTNTAFYKDFASGAIAGSNTLINAGSVDNIISMCNNINLTSVVNAVKNNTAVPADAVMNINNSLVQVLNLFRK